MIEVKFSPEMGRCVEVVLIQNGDFSQYGYVSEGEMQDDWRDLKKGRRVPAHRDPETGHPDAWYEAIESVPYEASADELFGDFFALFGSEEETVMEAVNIIKWRHDITGGDDDVLSRMAEESIFAYAYLQACRDWNRSWDDLQMIPSTNRVLEVLRKILLRTSWRSAEDAAKVRKYLEAAESLLEKRSRKHGAF